MVSKDQAIGGAIFIVCFVVAIFYLVTLFYPAWINNVFGTTLSESGIQFWIVAIPVFAAFVAIMGIGAWIGWTMATTPPPKPIEEITTEMEEKKEEAPPPPSSPEPVEEAKPPEETPPGSAEEKKPERKRRT